MTHSMFFWDCMTALRAYAIPFFLLFLRSILLARASIGS